MWVFKAEALRDVLIVVFWVVKLMNDFVFYASFVFLSMLFYFPSFWASFAWSGEDNGALKFYGVAMLNIYLYMSFMRRADIYL